MYLMIVSLVNNFKTISFLTSDTLADTESKKSRQFMQFLDINTLDKRHMFPIVLISPMIIKNKSEITL